MKRTGAISGVVGLIFVIGSMSMWRPSEKTVSSASAIRSSPAEAESETAFPEGPDGAAIVSSVSPSPNGGTDAPSADAPDKISQPPSQGVQIPEVVPEREEPSRLDWSGFEEARTRVEQLLSVGRPDHRDDRLPRIARTSAASNMFDRAAAAYLMFLEEFGTDHESSRDIVMLLGDTLAPMYLRSVDIRHTPEGPQFTPDWKRGHTPTTERLRQACDAYEWAADVGENASYIGKALLRLGWVHRVRGDMAASTEAWDRCARLATGTKAAADALWSAAENLAWTNQPLKAVDRLENLIDSHPNEPRLRSAESRIEALEAEARRGSEWMDDPIGSLEAEIASRSAVLGDVQVYRAVLTWLKRRQEWEAAAEVARWGGAQADWSESVRMECVFGLASVLQQNDRATAADIREAAELLTDIVRGDADDEWVVSAGLQRCQLFRKIDEPGPAMDSLEEIQTRIVGLGEWERMWYAEMIELLMDRGKVARAERYRQELSERFPDDVVFGG